MRYLCLQGSIPDMTALTATYLELQQIYREKAESDQAAMAAYVQSIAQSMRHPPKISTSTIRNFAKNARNLRSVRGLRATISCLYKYSQTPVKRMPSQEIWGYHRVANSIDCSQNGKL